jgi:signal transduction histidine kinase
MVRKLEPWEQLLRELRSEFLLREEELELLHAIDLRLLKDELLLEETFSFITDRTRALIRSDHASILLKRGRFLEVTYSTDNLDIGQLISIPGSIAGKCLTGRKAICISDLDSSPLKEKYVQIAGYTGQAIRSLLEVPIDFNEQPVGVLCVESCHLHAFRPVHTHILQAIASQVAIALQRVQHFKSAALFADVDQMIIAPEDTQHAIQHALQRVTDELHKLHRVQLSGAQIMFLKGDDELEIVHSTSPADIGMGLSIAESICGRAVRESRTVIVGDVSKDAQYRRMLGAAIQSEIAVPITLGEDKLIIGVLNVESEEPDAFSGFNQIVLEGFADKVRTLLAFAKLRTNLTNTLESRHASDLLIAVGDQTSNLIHRVNNSVGALRMKLLELQELCTDGKLLQDTEFLSRSLAESVALADRTLEMPEQVTKFLSQDGSTIDLNSSITEILRDISPPANIVLETDFDENLPQLALYSFDIVVQNLLRNAIDAMPSGGHLYVSTDLMSHVELPSGYVQLTVRDTGTGIPENILPHIFDLNFTTKRSKGNGLGLGLWWVRTFVLRSNGEISVQSTFNVGSEFCVKIPLATPVSGPTKDSAIISQ